MKKPLDKHFPIQTERDDLVKDTRAKTVGSVAKSKKNVGHKKKVYQRRTKRHTCR